MMHFVGLASVSGVLASQPHPVRQDLVDEINAQGSWRALPADSNRFANISLAEIKGMMGLKQGEKPGAGFRSGVTVGTIPESFDGSMEFSGCQKSIRDQAGCGSCWAFGAAETLTTNLCVLGLGNPVLSPQDMVSCDSSDNGCNGGSLQNAWSFIDSNGLRADDCVPYSAGDGEVESCPAVCTGYGDSTRYKCPVTPTYLDSDAEIQAAVMTVGAVEVGFYVYEDFMNYDGGIYTHLSGQVLGGHAVKIVGWGKQYDQFYWKVQNSWGSSWGESGFFKIVSWHDDMDSGIAIAGGHACLQGATPAPPAPPTPPDSCNDIVSYCSDYGKSKCEEMSYLIPVCLETCGCCNSYKPSYCPADDLVV